MDYQQAREIIYWHNKARSDIAGQGLCANMLQVTWSPILAQVAQTFVDNCTGVLSGHNPRRNSEFLQKAVAANLVDELCGPSARFGCVGENWAAGGGNCARGTCLYCDRDALLCDDCRYRACRVRAWVWFLIIGCIDDFFVAFFTNLPL